ncbi:MAG: hypothetical protein AB9873_14715 [Syntrophobacteraceae bacterium]
MGPNMKIFREKSVHQPTGRGAPARRSAVAESQQKLFQSVLSQMQGTGKGPLPQEINSLQQEMKTLQMAIPIVKPGGKVSFALQSPKSTQEGSLNAVAAATLLRLKNVSPRLGTVASSLINTAQTASSSGIEEPQRSATRSSRSLQRIQTHSGIGNLSARFESGSDGVDTIGYDEMGGTSYGTYQIASRTGTMRLFIDFLKTQAPDWARRLSASGPLNTGGRGGGVPREWKKIAEEDPDRFAKLQQDFIAETHYVPALQEIQERTGIDVQDQSKALQEVLWSTAVQHGPRGAARIFSKAIGGGGESKVEGSQNEQKLIKKVYSARGMQFGGSNSRVASAVRRRFEEEKDMALDMLNSGSAPRSFRA